MIKKMQQRFIRIAVISLAIAMVLVVAIVNLANWVSVRRELESTLDFLSENSTMDSRMMFGKGMMGKNKHAQNVVSESNWFSIAYDSGGNHFQINLSNMAEGDEELAVSLAEQALESGKKSGFLQDYLYQMSTNKEDQQVLVFLNCETKMTAVRTLALISLVACLGGIALALMLVSLASRRAIAPTIRNMEQQKQFITNASHELKTPLTVINTNLDLLEMENPESTFIRSAKKQTGQMRHLVDELVYLSRMEEENAAMSIEQLDFGALAAETAEPFEEMAEYKGLEFKTEIEKNLQMTGDRASLQRLVSNLCDNAVKYANRGVIRLEAASEGKQIRLSVSNETDPPLTKEQCDQLFLRFYRSDASRNKSKQSGFGIGLAIVAAIVEKHGGNIQAQMEGDRLQITCRIPRTFKD